MSENHRGPEVPEVEVRVVECRDGLARITLGTCNNSFCERWAPSRMLVRQDQELLPVWGEVLIRTPSGLMNSRRKDPNRIMTQVQ